MAVQRTKDTYQKQIYDFIKDILVVCPGCNKNAIVRTAKQPPIINIQEKEIKVVCTHCGFNKRLEEKPASVLFSSSSNKKPQENFIIIGTAIDPYFHLQLWLTINCCDNILWAYNYEHLEFIKQHVEAKLRERNTAEMKNNSLGSRLPKWMSSTKNRDTVLKAIIQLQQKQIK
ncbi:MAG: hypothetical protein ABIP51_21860 [Bacteroidia bacterium]